MDNFDLMRARLEARGGLIQQERMVQDKYKSLQKAILYSYQGAKIRKLNDDKIYGALINPNAVKQDYDDKTISIGYQAECGPGTIIEWANAKWLIYLQDLTELAYFHGDMRKCSYEVKWKDEKGDEHSTYIALRGPKETKMASSVYADISIDSPNYTLSFLVANTPENKKFFTRYSKFYLQELTKRGEYICWRVEAVDAISTPGILEIDAIEYYANEHEDDLQQGLVGNVIELSSEVEENGIFGLTIIRPKLSYTYKYQGSNNGTWSWDKTDVQKINETENEITLKWDNTRGGKFDLSFGDSKRTIIVESLF